MSVDIEALIVTFLRAQSTVTAIVEDRVYTDLPHARTYPLVLVTRTGGGYIYRHHLDAAEITIDCYGGTHKLALQLASVCMSTMAGQLVGGHPEGVVTLVQTPVVAYNPEPDSTDPQGHARPRYTVSAVVTAHP